MNHSPDTSNTPSPSSVTLGSQTDSAEPRSSRRYSSLLAVGPLAAALLALSPALCGAAPESKPADAAWAPGRILVLPRAGLSQSELAKILAVHGGKGRKIGQSDLHIVDLPGAGSEKAIAKLLSRHPQLKFAEVDERVAPHFAANDPYLGSQWHLSKVGAPAAWDISQGAGITLAILDTGVDGTHPDLAGRMVAGWNFFDNNSNTSDVYGHGTAVAGTAAATTDNSVGVASLAGQAKIMPVRIAGLDGYAYWSTVAQGLTYAADQGARVANISYGVAGSASVQSSAQYMKSKGGLVIVSAGNNGIDENIVPTTTMIAVSATDSADARTSWSSFGSFVAMSAPGAGIYTTVRGGGYGAWNGTSFSSPVTAGVVALVMATNPALDSAGVENILFNTAIDLGAAGRDPFYGYGRVNAAGAVQAAKAALPVVDTTPPTSSITAPLASSTVSGVVAVNVSASDNIGVTRVELRVNGATVAIDTAAPFSFSWDSTGVANGMANLTAYAFDAAGNSTASPVASVNVANLANVVGPIVADTTAPVVVIVNPVAGQVTGSVSVNANATDNSAVSGIQQTLYIDGVLKASVTGGTLAYSWNTRKVAVGQHILKVVARDAAGNAASSSVTVTR